MNEVLTLISSTEITDVWGDPIIQETHRDVFCTVNSIGTKEFYQASSNGMKPEIKFLLADYLDYKDEKRIEYNCIRYKVLRTYRNGQQLEITCYREVNQS